MAMHEDDVERVCRQGTQAWQRLKKDKNWNDWLKVGEALMVGREWAQRIATTNRPQGKAYNMAMSEWLQRYKLDDMDKGDRSRLFQVMDNLGQIEEWRKTLTLTERLKLNHPNAVLRKWKAHMAPEPRTESGEPKPTLRDSVVNLSEERDALKRELAQLKDDFAELEAAREATPAQSAPLTIKQHCDALIELLVKEDRATVRKHIRQFQTDLNAALDTRGKPRSAEEQQQDEVLKELAGDLARALSPQPKSTAKEHFRTSKRRS